MFSRSQPSTPVAAAKPVKSGPPGLSFIGPEVVVSGDVATSAQLHVDGRIDGCVRCAQLCEGATGVIAGDIIADEARIGGLIQGTVNARTLLVEGTGRITGDVTYETISIAAGAQIEGRLAPREVQGGAASTVGSPAVLIAKPAEAKPTAANKSDTEEKEKELFSSTEKRVGVA
ncbi:MAG: bactofilin family protein [Sphingosinicella sp.]